MYFETVPACLPQHGLGKTEVGPTQHGIKTNDLVCTTWGRVRVFQARGNVIGLFINERKKLLQFGHLEKELVSCIFQLFGK